MLPGWCAKHRLHCSNKETTLFTLINISFSFGETLHLFWTQHFFFTRISFLFMWHLRKPLTTNSWQSGYLSACCHSAPLTDRQTCTWWHPPPCCVIIKTDWCHREEWIIQRNISSFIVTLAVVNATYSYLSWIYTVFKALGFILYHCIQYDEKISDVISLTLASLCCSKQYLEMGHKLRYLSGFQSKLMSSHAVETQRNYIGTLL